VTAPAGLKPGGKPNREAGDRRHRPRNNPEMEISTVARLTSQAAKP